ncbi:hypothetical protein HpDR31_05060 [Helicobacter pylori]|nr:hypothetical protein KVE07_01100 [Helicobacter pylori]
MGNLSVWVILKTAKSNPNFNQSTTDTHDYIATIKLHYDTNGKLVKYHLKFEDFNSNVSNTTIPVMLMCGVRSGVALYDCGNTLPNNSNPIRTHYKKLSLVKIKLFAI